MSESPMTYRSHALPVQRVYWAPGSARSADDPRCWEAFCDALVECWRETALLSSWGARKLVQAEGEMPFAGGYVPKAPKVQTYRLAFVERQYPDPHRSWWDGMSKSASAALRRVEKVYAKTRYEQFGRMNRSHVAFKFPQPFPVSNQVWRYAGRDARGAPVVEVNLPGGKWRLTLRGGRELGRQLAAMRRIADGTAAAGEACLIGQSVPGGRSGGRPVFDARAAGGGRRKFWRVMFRFVAKEAAREAPAAATNALSLSCDPAAYWVAQAAGRSPWVVNADHIRRTVAAHRDYLRRIADDTKYEKRLLARRLRQINDARAVRCEKHARRIKTFQQESAASVADYARRCGCDSLVFDDSRGAEYLPDYPWAAQRTYLAHALAARGILFEGAASDEE